MAVLIAVPFTIASWKRRHSVTKASPRVGCEREIVEEMSTLFESSVPPGTDIRYAIARGLPTIEADPAQIAQIVVNLVTNAIKHSRRDDLHRMETRAVGEIDEGNARLGIAPGTHPALDGDGLIGRGFAAENLLNAEFCHCCVLA